MKICLRLFLIFLVLTGVVSTVDALDTKKIKRMLEVIAHRTENKQPGKYNKLKSMLWKQSIKEIEEIKKKTDIKPLDDKADDPWLLMEDGGQVANSAQKTTDPEFIFDSFIGKYSGIRGLDEEDEEDERKDLPTIPNKSEKEDFLNISDVVGEALEE